MSVELSQEQIRTLLQGISIPPQPQIMVDLHMEQASPDCSIARISQLISRDVGLTGSILKTVNSPFYGLANKITSVQQACTLLGINSVINIVNALSIRGELSDEAIMALNLFWDNATDIANACIVIAKETNFQAPDEAYTMGLFHNCGIPLLMKQFANYPEVMVNSYARAGHGRRIIDEENDALNTNHAVVGYYVAKSWNLPVHICEAIAEHHSAAAVFSDGDSMVTGKKDLLAILKMAEHICGNYQALGHQEYDHEWTEIEARILDYLNLSPYEFSNLQGIIQDQGIAAGQYLTL